MSSFETIRVHPGRLPSTAYTPYGDPLNPPPTWDAPPPDHPTSSASTSHIVRFGSEPRTPPPPYSDHGESYDQHASFLDEESVSGDEGDDYEEYFEGEDGYDEEWEEDIHALEREIEVPPSRQPQQPRPSSLPQFDPEDLITRLETTNISPPSTNNSSEMDLTASLDLSSSILSTPQVIKSSTDTPEYLEDVWKFPDPQPRPRRASILRVRDPLPGTTYRLDTHSDEAQYQIAFCTHLNARSSSSAGPSSAPATQGISGYTTEDADRFRAGYGLWQERERVREAAAESLRMQRVGRDQMKEVRKAQQMQEEEWLHQALVRAGTTNHVSRGVNTPPIPARPIGEIPSWSTFNNTSRSAVQLSVPPVPTRPSLTRSTAYTGPGRHPHHTSLDATPATVAHQSPPSSIIPKPLLSRMASASTTSGMSTSAPSTFPSRHNNKPLPGLPAPTPSSFIQYRSSEQTRQSTLLQLNSTRELSEVHHN